MDIVFWNRSERETQMSFDLEIKYQLILDTLSTFFQKKWEGGFSDTVPYHVMDYTEL